MTSSEQRYVALRKRLDQLGFQQPLGMESLPLVQRLLADLVRTTTSLKNARKGAPVHGGGNVGGGGDASSATTVAIGMALGQSSLESYKLENSRLVRENTDVHLKLLKEKEDHEKSLKAVKSDFRKVEHQNTDLRFLNSQYLHKLGVLEREAEEKTKRILKLQEQNFQAVVHTPGGSKKPVPFRRQRMDIESLLDAAQSVETAKMGTVSNFVAIDLVSVADKRIENLEQELASKNESLSSMSSSTNSLQQSVSVRDSEIIRLHRLLDGGRPEAAVDAAAREDSMQKMMTRLNDQLNLLREENQSLHDQVSALKEKHLVGDKENLKNTDSSGPDASSIKRELESLSSKVSDLKTAKEKLLAEKEAEIGRLEADAAGNKECLVDADVKIKQLTDDKDAAQLRINDLVETMKNLENDLNRVQTDSRSFEELMLKERQQREDSAHLLKTVESQSEDLRAELGRVRSNLNECERLLEMEKGVLNQAREEMREKQQLISQLESEKRGFETKSQELSDARDRIQLKLHQVEGEVERLQMQLLKEQNKDLNQNIPDLHSDRLVAYSVVTRLESERESLLSDRKRLAQEKDAVAAEKEAVFRTASDRESELRCRISELEARIGREEREKENLAVECTHLRETVETMRHHMQTMEQQVQLSVDELRNERQHASDFRSENSGREKELADLRRKLVDLEAEAKIKEEVLTATEAKSKAEGLKLTRLKKDLEKTKAALTTVDRERDIAQEALDDKTERLSTMESRVDGLKTTMKLKEEEIRSLESELDRLSSEVENRSKAGDFLRADLQGFVDAERDWRMEAEALTRRSRQMAKDAEELTGEVQRAEREKEELKKKLVEMEEELNRERITVSQASQMVSGSQTQHDQMLSQMQDMNSQMLELELRVRDVEAENARLQTEVDARHYEKSHIAGHLEELQSRLQYSEEEISVRESRSHSLATEIEDLKMDLKNARQTIETLERDLYSMRGLAAQLDSSKDKTQLELANRDALCQQLGKEITARDHECSALRAALLQEQTSMTNLETVVATTREREFVEQVEKEQVKELLEDKTQMLEKIEEENRSRREEVTSLHRMLAESESFRSSLEAEVTKYQYEAELSGRSSTSSLIRAGRSRVSGGGDGERGGGGGAVVGLGEAGDGLTDEIIVADSNNNEKIDGGVDANSNNNNSNPGQRNRIDNVSKDEVVVVDPFSPRSRDDNSEATLKDVSAISSDLGVGGAGGGGSSAPRAYPREELVSDLWPTTLSQHKEQAVTPVSIKGSTKPKLPVHFFPTTGESSALRHRASSSSLPDPTASGLRHQTPSPRLAPQPDPLPTPHLASSSLNASLQPSPIPSNESSASLSAHSRLSGRPSPLSSTPASAVVSPISSRAPSSRGPSSRASSRAATPAARGDDSKHSSRSHTKKNFDREIANEGVTSESVDAGAKVSSVDKISLAAPDRPAKSPLLDSLSSLNSANSESGKRTKKAGHCVDPIFSPLQSSDSEGSKS